MFSKAAVRRERRRGRCTRAEGVGLAEREMAEGLSPPSWARDENATMPTPEGGGLCGHAFRLESLPATGTSPEGRGECYDTKTHSVSIHRMCLDAGCKLQQAV